MTFGALPWSYARNATSRRGGAMSERTSYAPGTPCWVDLGTPDIEASEAFYGELFGWEIPELPNSARLGGYRRAKKNGKDVAGVAPLMQEGQPPAWSTYVSVADAAATLAAVGEAGGQVIVEPMDVVGPRHDGASSSTRPAPSAASGSRGPSPAPSSSTSPAASAGTSSGPATPPPPSSSTAPSSAGTSRTTTWGRWGPTRPGRSARRWSAACSTSAASSPTRCRLTG